MQVECVSQRFNEAFTSGSRSSSVPAVSESLKNASESAAVLRVAVLASGEGSNLQAIIDSVHGVSGIMGEIALASREQNAGIAQVNVAVIQMDEVTQQNAALVEQAAAAAASLRDQTQNVVGALSVFKLNRTIAAGTACASTPVKPGKPVKPVKMSQRLPAPRTIGAPGAQPIEPKWSCS